MEMVEGSFIVHGRLFHADDPEKDKLVLYILMRGRGRMYNLLVRPYTDLDSLKNGFMYSGHFLCQSLNIKRHLL